jgi:hypothetical protein
LNDGLDTGASSSRSYWEVWGRSPFNAVDISIPVAVTVFPGEIYRAPRSWAERNFHKLIYFNEVDKGGHFAAWEQPELFTTEVRERLKEAHHAAVSVTEGALAEKLKRTE